MTTTTARIVKIDTDGLRSAGELLRKGKLVAFPTETVYGLGANALDEDAVLSIFKAKGRPLSDPVIVHVPSVDAAVALADLDTKGEEMFRALASQFWPGALTLITKSGSRLPSCVSAGTGFVGFRCPSHPVALALLKEARVPVAAPSANRFGHVSPTRAQHVMTDLFASDIAILDDSTLTDVCMIGIESTVAKLVPETRELIILRRGGVSEKALSTSNAYANLRVRAVDTLSCVSSMPTTDARHQAPGQLLTHYAPDIETFLVNVAKSQDSGLTAVSDAAIIDFGGRLLELKHSAMAYMDLSEKGSIEEASQKLYGALRWAENCENICRIFLIDLSDNPEEHAAALRDRMYRSASGKSVLLNV